MGKTIGIFGLAILRNTLCGPSARGANQYPTQDCNAQRTPMSPKLARQ